MDHPDGILPLALVLVYRPQDIALPGTPRTVRGGKMIALEFLRVVERDGGWLYVAQPGGAPTTEFVLTEWGGTRAVFENPRHDFP